MVKNIIVGIKAFFIWILKEKNRGISMKYIKLAINLAKKITPLTKTDKDDKGLQYVMSKFNQLTQDKTQKEINQLAEIIDKDNKNLEGLNLNILTAKDNGAKIQVTYGIGKVEYNSMNGEIKTGINL